MISIKVPLRVSLFGGGSDLPNHFSKHGGVVVGYTINRYICIHSSKIEVDQGFKFRLSYKSYEEINDLDEIQHPIFREVLREYEFDEPYCFTTMSNLPAGAGLGSSSAFTVGLYYLLDELCGNTQTELELAKRAINIERNVLGEAGGWQDQLHPAFGGVNSFEFLNDGTILRRELKLPEEDIERLNSSMYLLYSGEIRQAKNIEKSKLNNSNDVSLTEIRDIAREGELLMSNGGVSLSDIGRLLNYGWEIKRSLSKSVSNANIDYLYKLILKSGAYGAKLCGSGGGGFFMVLANPKSASLLSSKLPSGRLSKIKIDLEGLKRFDI